MRASTTTRIILALAAAAALWLVAQPAGADSAAVCLAPGPHGEALSCAGEFRNLPESYHDRAHIRILTGLDGYSKYTPQLVQPRLHWWQGQECRVPKSRYRRERVGITMDREGASLFFEAGSWQRCWR